MSIQVKKIEKKVRVTLFESVKFQIMYEILFRKKDTISSSDIDILTFLSIVGSTELSKFCTKLTKTLYKDVKPEEFAIKSQNIRNRLGKMIKKGYVIKDGSKIKIDPSLEIVIHRNMLLTYNFLTVETNKA